MDQPLQALDEVIRRKVSEGIFASREAAIQSILAWLEKQDRHFVYAQMRSEDA